jgi:penicillin-binding protein 2
VLAGLALIIFAILFLRLWALQVLSGDRYLNAAQNNQLRTIRVEAQRGSIVDRSGRTIVSNVPGTGVRIWTADLPEEGRYAMFKRLSKILRVPLPRLTKALEENKGDPLTPILVKTAVHEDQVATLLEHRADVPRRRVASTYLRDYEHKALAAQLLGYVGEVSPEELKRSRAKDRTSAAARRSARRASRPLRRYLRGTPGTASCASTRSASRSGASRPAARTAGLQRPADARHRPAAGRRARAPRRDRARLRRTTVERERRRDRRARPARRRRARDGVEPDLQAVVYVGRVDPKKLEPLTSRRWRRSATTPASTARSPASIRRLDVQAADRARRDLRRAALARTSTSSAPVSEVRLDEQTFKNWNPYTNMPMTLSTALSQSCDTYFYDVGNRYFERGEHERPYWTKMQAWAKKFGFGQRPGSTSAARRRPAADARLAQARRPHRLGQGVEPGRPDPARRSARRTSTSRPLRWRASMPLWRTAASSSRRTSCRRPSGRRRRRAGVPVADLPGCAAEGDRRRPGAHRGRARRPLRGDARRQRHLVRVFGSFPVPVAGKTGTAEKVVNLPGYPVGHLEDQAWWCGLGPVRRND